MKPLTSIILSMLCGVGSAAIGQHPAVNSYFLTTYNNVNGFLYVDISNPPGVATFIPNPYPVKFAAIAGGDQIQIILMNGLYYLKGHQDGSVEVVNAYALGASPPATDTSYLWTIEPQTIAGQTGSFYSIKSAFKDGSKPYYLYSPSYSSLSLTTDINATTDPGSFWEFLPASPGFANHELTILDAGGNETAYTLFCTEAGDIQLSDESQPTNWFWKMTQNVAESTARFEMTNPKNEKRYLKSQPSLFPYSGPLVAAENPFSTLAKGWMQSSDTQIQLKRKFIYSPSSGYSTWWLSGDTLAHGTHWNESGIGINTAKAPSSVSYDASTSYIVPELALRAESVKENYPAVSGNIVQDMVYHSSGSLNFYIYGGADSLVLIRRHSSEVGFKKKSIQPTAGNSIHGISLYKSYMYVMNGPRLELYSLYGMENSNTGYVYEYKDPLADPAANTKLSAPVYNALSHQVFILSDKFVFGAGQALDSASFLNPHEASDTIPLENRELFVIPSSDALTYLYYVNASNQIVTLAADNKSILPHGTEIPATKEAIQWLRYKTRMLKQPETLAGQKSMQLTDGFVAKGKLDAATEYVLIIEQDSLLNVSRVKLYTGLAAAFPTFSGTSLSAVTYGTSAQVGTWEIKSPSGNNVWMSDNPLVICDTTTQSFNIQGLGKASPNATESKVYSFTITPKTNTPGSFNMIWQQADGKLSEVPKDSDLHRLHEFNSVLSSNPFGS